MTGAVKGRVLELFFIDGRPDGMVTADVFNWPGHVLMTPRTQLGEALKRDEAKATGIYLLLGEKDGAPFAYIGEADAVNKRIGDHDSKKDWWDRAVLITSANNKLNKAHVRYLEARLIALAHSAKKVDLENGTTPPLPRLTEAEEVNMEVFLENILMVLPALRIDIFVKGARPESASADDKEAIVAAPVFELRVPKRNLYATARLISGEFIIQTGSVAAKSWESPGYEDGSYARLFANLVQTGTLREQGENRIFTENYAFTSVSAAASVVNGHPTSGPLAWKVQGQQKTYKEWEAEKLIHNSQGKQ